MKQTPHHGFLSTSKSSGGGGLLPKRAPCFFVRKPRPPPKKKRAAKTKGKQPPTSSLLAPSLPRKFAPRGALLLCSRSLLLDPRGLFKYMSATESQGAASAATFGRNARRLGFPCNKAAKNGGGGCRGGGGVVQQKDKPK